jgi:hypothetical protein
MCGVSLWRDEAIAVWLDLTPVARMNRTLQQATAWHPLT